MQTQTRQKKVSLRIRNRKAKTRLVQYAAGAVIGGIVPATTWDIAHSQTQAAPMLWLAVAGGLAYSAPMVAQWFSRYVGNVKGWGFVVSLETALTFTSLETALPALAVLTALNAFILSNRFAQD